MLESTKNWRAVRTIHHKRTGPLKFVAGSNVNSSVVNMLGPRFAAPPTDHRNPSRQPDNKLSTPKHTKTGMRPLAPGGLPNRRGQ
eukprot:5339081-Alexandrium_andersonii.AAC.1